MKSQRRNVSEDDHPQTIVQRSSQLDPDELSSKIPIELIIEIFSRLPLNSIARCRCVSKQWASILRRTDFTDLFLARSSARPKLSFLFLKQGEFRFFSSPQPPRENESLITVTIDHHVSFPIERVEHISRPLNGFFCISDTQILEGSKTRERVWVICNPSTKQSFTLPKLKTTRKEGTKLISFLGYDPIEKQHKVLAMTKEDDRAVEHQVLTLGRGNLTWRMAECGIPHSFPRRACLCINGVLYYTGVSNFVEMIICFDVRSEKYSFVKAAATERGLFSGKMINFLGKLALVTHPKYCFPRETSIGLEMWILEDAEKHEWSKRIFNLPPICNDRAVEGKYLNFVGVTTANEFVFSQYLPSDPFHVYYYNFVKEAISRVVIQGFGVFDENVSIAYVSLNHVEDVKIMELL